MRKLWGCRDITVLSSYNSPHSWSREERCTAWGEQSCSGFYLLVKLFSLMKIWMNWLNWTVLSKDNSVFQKHFLSFAHNRLFIAFRNRSLHHSFYILLILNFTGMFPVTMMRLLATLPAAQSSYLSFLFISCCHKLLCFMCDSSLFFNLFNFFFSMLHWKTHITCFQLYLHFSNKKSDFHIPITFKKTPMSWLVINVFKEVF